MNEIWAWLRMKDAGGTMYGKPRLPSSESSYHANSHLIDTVMPVNGGTLQADGTWLQRADLIDPAWPQSLPGLAQSAGQSYMPVVGIEADAVVPILDSPALQQTAADNLVTLATSTRFDTPWDGVYLDLESIPLGYRAQLSNFLHTLSYHLRSVGMQVGVSVKGRVDDNGTHDLAVVAQMADYVDIRCYGFYDAADPLYSYGPYWWVRDCIEFALSQGIPAQRVTVGIGGYGRYWETTGQSGFYDLTNEAAIELINDNNAFIQWIESGQSGLIRQKYADVGSGHLWLNDGETMRHDLDIIDNYSLRGMTYWIAGMENPDLWSTIEDWRE